MSCNLLKEWERIVHYVAIYIRFTEFILMEESYFFPLQGPSDPLVSIHEYQFHSFFLSNVNQLLWIISCLSLSYPVRGKDGLKIQSAVKIYFQIIFRFYLPNKAWLSAISSTRKWVSAVEFSHETLWVPLLISFNKIVVVAHSVLFLLPHYLKFRNKNITWEE